MTAPLTIYDLAEIEDHRKQDRVRDHYANDHMHRHQRIADAARRGHDAGEAR